MIIIKIMRGPPGYKICSIALLLSIIFAGCIKETKVPIETIHYIENEGKRNAHLFILLPGRNAGIRSYEKNGFIQSVREKGLPVDVVAVDAHLGYYQSRSIVIRLEEDVFRPAKAGGYDRIWIAGTSMGGLGALLYAMKDANEITGLILIAPYLGDEEVIHEISRAGGLEQWDPGRIPEDDWQRRIWVWLKKNGRQKNTAPHIYLAYGKNDKFAFSNAILAEILPHNRVAVMEGGHDWDTFKALWDTLLGKIDF